MKKNSKFSIARIIGKTLACLQDMFDIALKWGFAKLKSLKFKGRQGHSKKGIAKNILRKILNFFGELGNSFYMEYERLKQKRSKH